MKKFLIFMFLFICTFGIENVKALDTGTYKIVSVLDETKALTSTENGNIEIDKFESTDNQFWNVIVQKDGSYIITSRVDSNKSFDVAGGSTANGTNIRLYDTNKTDAQKWYIRMATNGSYYIVSKLKGLSVVDIVGGNSSDGTNVQLYKANYTNAQKFKFVEVVEKSKTTEDGTYIINSKLNNSLAVSLASNLQDGGNVVNGLNKFSYSNAWNIKYLEDGFYQISAYSDENMLLGIKGENVSNGNNVQINSSNESDNNKWIIKKNSDNTYSLVSAIDGYYADVTGGNVNADTNIQLYEGNGTNSQKFTLSKVDFSKVEDGFYTISSSVNNNIVLALNNEVTANNGNIELAAKIDSNSQKWYIKNIENNIYEIKSAINQDYVFDVAGGSTANKANIQLYKTNGTNAQRWIIVKFDNDIYHFINVLSGKTLDIAWGNVSNGTNIQLYENNGTQAQKFKLTKTEISSYSQIIENGEYMLYTALNLNKSVRYTNSTIIFDIEGSTNEIFSLEYVNNGFYKLKINNKVLTNNNGIITLCDYSENDNQLWYVVKKGDYYVFISKYDGKALDVSGGSTANNTKVQTYTINGTNSQKFLLEPVSSELLNDGYYTISNNNRSLGLSAEMAYNGAKIESFSGEITDKQKWYIKKVKNNLYEIKYALNPNKVMDVKGGGTVNGTDVQAYSCNGTPAQRWYLINLKDDEYKFISSKSHTYLTLYGANTVIYSNDKTKGQIFNVARTDEVTAYGKSIDNGYYTIASSLTTGKVLDVTGGSMSSGTNVQLYSSNNTLAQIWKFNYVNDGQYEIISSMNPKRALTNSNNNVQINKYTGADNQRWYVKMLEDNKVSIISAVDGKNIDVSSGSTANGTNIGVYNNNGTSAQKFILNVYGSQKTYKGVDVSSHQGTIDWSKLSNTGIHFAIMRIGYGKYSDQKDSQFEKNYAGANNYDIPTAVYTYSYVYQHDNSVSEAKQEADVVLGWLNNRQIDLPVFYDLEDADNYKVRHGGIPNYDTMTNMALKFCSTIIAGGYKCGIYASKSWLETRMDVRKIAEKYPIWVAHYTGPDDYDSVLNNLPKYKTKYNYTPFSFWQFSSLGSMNGIGTSVDLDFGYDIFD